MTFKDDFACGSDTKPLSVRVHRKRNGVSKMTIVFLRSLCRKDTITETSLLQVPVHAPSC